MNEQNRAADRRAQADRKAAALDISRLHLATASFGISNGLFEAVHNFIAAYPQTNFIVIDTLERIRDGGRDRDIYSCDYSERYEQIPQDYR